MKSLAEFFLFGFLGALAVGPALASVYFAAMQDADFPAAELAGVLAGELIYFAAALALVRVDWAGTTQFAQAVELLAAIVLVYFAVHTFINFKKAQAFRRRRGFIGSVLLVLLNPNILLIDLMLVVEATSMARPASWIALLVYWIGVCTGTPAVMSLIRKNQPAFVRFRKPLEAVAAVFFLLIGIKLAANAALLSFPR